MLADQLGVQLILEFAERHILVPGDRNGGRLVSSGVYFDMVLECIVVDVIWWGAAIRSVHARYQPRR